MKNDFLKFSSRRILFSAAMASALMGIFCQMAYNIGEDLYTYDGGKAIAMAEYIAKYNLYKKDETNITGANSQFVYSRTNFPYTPYFYCNEQMFPVRGCLF